MKLDKYIKLIGDNKVVLLDNENVYVRDMLLKEYSSKLKTILVDEIDISELNNVLRTKSLMGGDNYYLLKISDKTLTKKVNLDKKKVVLGERLIDILANSVYKIFLVIDKIDTKKKFIKEIKDKYVVIEFDKLDEKYINSFIDTYSKSIELEIDSKAKKEFINRVDIDLYLIKNELDKLSLLDKDIKVADVDFYIRKSSSAITFELFNYIAKKELKQSLMLLDELLSTGTGHFAIVALIERNLINMNNAKLYSKDLAKVIKMPPFIANKLLEQASSFSKRFILESMELLCDIEIKLKRGYNKDLLLEYMIIKLCERSHS